MSNRSLWWSLWRTAFEDPDGRAAHNGWWQIQTETGYAWLPASPVGEEARKLALLECVPSGTEVSGVGYRHTRYTFEVEGV